MGEYYEWVNIDKKEYISPVDFDLGNKLHESASERNPLLGALYNLLASDWKGDAIVFLGDQTNITENDKNPVLRRLSAERQAWGEPGYDADYVDEVYQCISGLFRAAEYEVRQEIDYMVENNDFTLNCYRVDPANPYEGLFVRDSRFFRYTVNLSKKEYFDAARTRLTYINEEGKRTIRINPLPLLMAFPGEDDKCTGLWLGDQIVVSDDAPPEDFADMSEVYGWDFEG